MTPSLNMPGSLRRMSSRCPSDYFLSPKLKEYLSGTRFSSDSDVEIAVENWLNGKGRDFYHVGLNKLARSSDKCLNRFGACVEKLSASIKRMPINSHLYLLSNVNK
ncbi:hypothetical protein AVEN_842-1 [Araneus ventricosus]|uniref:Uncharacterized protein n=1 Tax=Araneus ventricosus TaxID=182803 RepID=A0A4Y2JKB6_ARAVE|nr:hypothetical protein AVEN_842-1 [Araneus ventricosus]